MGSVANAVHREPWNKGKIVGQKAPFKVKDIWALRVRLQMENRVRELALQAVALSRGRHIVRVLLAAPHGRALFRHPRVLRLAR
jgi:hypothetical protein